MHNALGHQGLLTLRHSYVEPLVGTHERPPVMVAGVMICPAAAAAENVAGKGFGGGVVQGGRHGCGLERELDWIIHTCTME